MKKSALVLTCLFFILGYTVKAQIVVFSQNKCNNVEDVLKLIKEEFGPFLNAQVDAGNLMNWGILTHSWGDEWNFNIYYSAENFTKFQAAFSEAVKNSREKYPDSFKKFQEACFEHKDNIYNSAYVYPAGEDDSGN